MCIVLGVIFVVGGFIFWFYIKDVYIGGNGQSVYQITHPYRHIAIIPFTLGIFLFLLVGVIKLVRREEETINPSHSSGL